jgi:hypothetical protein
MKRHEFHEGPEAKTRFETAVKKILTLRRSELERREKQYQEEQAHKPKRGPKRKAKPSASRDHDSGG